MPFRSKISNVSNYYSQKRIFIQCSVVRMFLLARDRLGAGHGSHQMSVYAVFCRAIPEVQNGLLCLG
jgi:hypothetical protein